jgi:hypothetical protein
VERRQDVETGAAHFQSHSGVRRESLGQVLWNQQRRAQKFAEDQLRSGMFRAGGAYTAIAAKLLDTREWLTHGQMISWQSASAIGLDVEYLPLRSD